MSIKKKIIEYDFFPGLSSSHVDALAEFGTEVDFPESAFLIREGAPAENFYLILDGHISLELPAHHHVALILQTLGPGDILGWSWIVPPHVNRFDALARENSRAIVFDGKRLREACEKDHELGFELLKAVASVFVTRLESTRLRLMDVYGVAK